MVLCHVSCHCFATILSVEARKEINAVAVDVVVALTWDTGAGGAEDEANTNVVLSSGNGRV